LSSSVFFPSNIKLLYYTLGGGFSLRYARDKSHFPHVAYDVHRRRDIPIVSTPSRTARFAHRWSLGEKTLPLSRHTCLACTRCYYYINIFLLLLSCKLKILYTFTRSYQTSRAYWMTLWREYNNTMRFVHLLPCTINYNMCDAHTHTHTHTPLSHSYSQHTHTLARLNSQHTTGYDRGEPSPHIPRVCVRVEDAPRWRRRANARRRPAACAACRVYRTRVMRWRRRRWQREARGRSGVYISRRRCRRRVRTGIDLRGSTVAVKSSVAYLSILTNKYIRWWV